MSALRVRKYFSVRRKSPHGYRTCDVRCDDGGQVQTKSVDQAGLTGRFIVDGIDHSRLEFSPGFLHILPDQLPGFLPVEKGNPDFLRDIEGRSVGENQFRHGFHAHQDQGVEHELLLLVVDFPEGVHDLAQRRFGNSFEFVDHQDQGRGAVHAAEKQFQVERVPYGLCARFDALLPELENQIVGEGLVEPFLGR